MGTTYTEFTTLTKHTCYNCGILYAIPEGFDNRCRSEQDKTWYCPNGHATIYSTSDVTKLKRQLAQEVSRHDQTRANLKETKKNLIVKKGQITKLKKRVSHGVCPCCHRSFTNLRRHMDTKHPKYSPVETKKKTNKHLNILGNLKAS